ncbi:MAG: nucleotidyl transferase AbiEii/AbiGii toxin family protein [Nanoarchaeota archaeon]|nr:nucleotidyl transferase AbiEii/AbiGii toxin family protein [Nanoarchaeota archaeon]MBU4300943.1 nucleotidyl transferase AbiEii/AbiGii toxin family protein [Nanoarchaeota archaeon]MBU4452257.1 nucleotidyl transferase AbiEii/AbiGii toxin family protein [Nanoarchaeota archaeon]MCG2724527.1 nucleotidyl transferase AbiEii/AbiGii toxin family protein [archaeon]
MLTEEDIRRIARVRGMNVGLTEKDYAIDWLLKGIYASKIGKSLLFKGGTAIKKVYFQETWRFSHDVDFTALNLKISDMENLLNEVFRNIESESSVRMDFGSFHKTEGSIIASVQFIGPLNAKNRIRVDITFNEKVIEKPAHKTIKSPYPDIESYSVYAYSLNEVLAEKIRSIIQRGKSRDYYDVWLLLKTQEFDMKKIRELLDEKCRFKGIEFRKELIFEKEKRKTAKSFWEAGLKELVKNLPDFEQVINELELMLKKL